MLAGLPGALGTSGARRLPAAAAIGLLLAGRRAVDLQAAGDGGKGQPLAALLASAHGPYRNAPVPVIQ